MFDNTLVIFIMNMHKLVHFSLTNAISNLIRVKYKKYRQYDDQMKN